MHDSIRRRYAHSPVVFRVFLQYLILGSRPASGCMRNGKAHSKALAQGGERVLLTTSIQPRLDYFEGHLKPHPDRGCAGQERDRLVKPMEVGQHVTQNDFSTRSPQVTQWRGGRGPQLRRIRLQSLCCISKPSQAEES